VAPLREPYYLLDFNHNQVRGTSIFVPQNDVVDAVRSWRVFCFLFGALCAQKWSPRWPRGAPCDPKAPKSPPGDFQKSMTNRPRGLRECPDVPGDLGGTSTPRTQKKHQNKKQKTQQRTPSGISQIKRRSSLRLCCNFPCVQYV
jgi:hypothetical protein